MNQITEAEVAEFFAGWKFIHGAGDYVKHEACIMSADVAITRAMRGEDLGRATDQSACISPVIRQLAIARNDYTPEADLRAWVLGLLPRIHGTAGSKELERRRAAAVARYACRVIAAEAMERAGLSNEASKLRTLDDEASMGDCFAVAIAAKDSAEKVQDGQYASVAYAAYAAEAASRAAYAAYAAEAARAARAAAERLQATKLRHLDAMIEICLAFKDGGDRTRSD
jgi:hypothetical protein